MIDKIPCEKCKELILPTTAENTAGICMACKQGIREAIEQSKEFYRKQKEYDPYRELWNFLMDKEEKVGFENFTEEEKIYVAVNILEGEVYRGGMEVFFWNTSGELYSDAVIGLCELEAKKSLALLKEAKQILFGENKPPKDRQKRWDLMKEHTENKSSNPNWNKRLHKIDERFNKDLDNLFELLIKYARQTGLIQPFEKSSFH